MTWKIQAITSELTGQEIGIDRDMVVGRHQSADIVLQAAEISRKHAAFLLKDQALWVQDLNSSNGSFVNDLRIEHETLLKEGDIVQFASLKFSVLAPAQEVVAATIESAEVEAVPAQPEVIPTTEQPSEAVAVSETEAAQVEEASKTAAQQMNEQGMPSLTERDREVQVSRDGMPQQVAIPKPAPIPAGVDVQAVPEPQPIAVEEPVSRVEQVKQEQKNASIGLISIIALIILAIIAWLLFK
ncbi:FHA domain protein [compost metagenome]